MEKSNFLKEIINNNFPNIKMTSNHIVKNVNKPQEETETTTPRKSITKPQRMKYKEWILKSARGKKNIFHDR